MNKKLNSHTSATISSVRLMLTIFIFAIVLLLAACQQQLPSVSSPAPEAAEPAPTATRNQPSAPTEAATPRIPYNGADVLPGQPIPDEVALRLMYDLSHGGDEAVIRAVIDSLRTSQDERFVPVLIEMLRFGQIGITSSGRIFVDTLETLTGQQFGNDWPAWVEWYGETDITPPPGFTGWKGAVLARIDPGFGDFLQDEYPSAIRSEEIQWGGVTVDGIPALDHATMIAPEAATYLSGDDPVFGIALNGDARAYPLRILDWHEMANDTVGGIPVSIAYCTLCGAAIAYDGRASDGETYDFGSSGFLFRSNKLMYDRQTRTLWNQLTGEPVLGPLVDSDVTLELLPVVLSTWDQWRAQHPDTLVLDVDTGFDRPYDLGAAYGDYFSASDTMFPVWQRSDLLDTKDQVYALRIDDQPAAYPLDILAEEQVVNDTVGATNLVVIAQRGPVTASGTSRRSGNEVAYTAGSEVRVYDRDEHTFTPGETVDTVIDESGRAWQVTEEALVGPDGETAPRVNGHLAYWFGWFSFFPNTLVYGID